MKIKANKTPFKILNKDGTSSFYYWMLEKPKENILIGKEGWNKEIENKCLRGNKYKILDASSILTKEDMEILNGGYK